VVDMRNCPQCNKRIAHLIEVSFNHWADEIYCPKCNVVFVLDRGIVVWHCCMDSPGLRPEFVEKVKVYKEDNVYTSRW